MIEKVYERGSYKIYVASSLGKSLLELLESGVSLSDIVEAGVKAYASVNGGVAGIEEAESLEDGDNGVKPPASSDGKVEVEA